MKHKGFILLISISVLSLSVLAFSLILGSKQSDEVAETVTSALPNNDSPAPGQVSNATPTHPNAKHAPFGTSEPSPAITSAITPSITPSITSINPQPSPVKLSQTAPDLDASRQEVLASLSNSLRIDEGLTDQNLLILRQVNERMALSNEELELLALPQDFLQALQALSRASMAEEALQKQWHGQILKDVHGYQAALLSQRKEILGGELYARLHEPDKIIASEDGYSVDYVQAESDMSDHDRLVRDKQDPLLQAWQRGELSETELRESLLTDLPEQAVDQVIESAQHELDWQHRLERFLNEYQYVEQAGLEGEDEKQVRLEMLERYFSEEDYAAAEQFLFGEQALAALPSKLAEHE